MLESPTTNVLYRGMLYGECIIEFKGTYQGACSLQLTMMRSLISPMLKIGCANPLPSCSNCGSFTKSHLMKKIHIHDLCNSPMFLNHNIYTLLCYSTVRQSITRFEILRFRLAADRLHFGSLASASIGRCGAIKGYYPSRANWICQR
jgi:hypothetical protein